MMFSIFAIPAIGQQIGLVNTGKILEAMPEYNPVKQKIDSLKNIYDATISAEMKKVEILYNSYQSQKPTLSDPQRKAKENEIISKERMVKELQKNYLGQDGELATKSAELLEPVKSKVNVAIQAVADEMKILIIFDASTLQGVVYNSPKIDLTDAVIKKLQKQ